MPTVCKLNFMYMNYYIIHYVRMYLGGSKRVPDSMQGMYD